MKALLFISSFALAVISPHAFADFDFPGTGTLRYPTGVEKPFQFGFAWQAQSETVTIGSKSYNMALPESYSVAITLSKDESQIWVQEFNNGFIEGFEWQIGDHHLSLKKKQFSEPVKGNYIMTLDGREYFLARNNISVEIDFNDEGIAQIAIDGVTKNMGTKK